MVGSAACENKTVDKGMVVFFNFQRKAKTENEFHKRRFHATCEFKPSKCMDFEQIIKGVLSLRTFFAQSTELGHKSDPLLLRPFFLAYKKSCQLNAVSCQVFRIIPGNSGDFGKIKKQLVTGIL